MLFYQFDYNLVMTCSTLHTNYPIFYLCLVHDYSQLTFSQFIGKLFLTLFMTCLWPLPKILNLTNLQTTNLPELGTAPPQLVSFFFSQLPVGSKSIDYTLWHRSLFTSNSAPRRVSSLIEVLGVEDVELEVIGQRVEKSGDAPNITSQSLVSLPQTNWK